MTIAADQLDDTPSPTDLQQFIYLANNVFELLETTKRELERDREAAKASLATASSILQSEIERRSRAKGVRPGALAGWQLARVRAFIDANLHRTIHTMDLSAIARRSTAHFSRSFKKAVGEPPHAYVVRRRLERACHLMITSSASLSEIALTSAFPIKHICAGNSGRRLVKVHPAGGATLRTGADEDHPIVRGSVSVTSAGLANRAVAQDKTTRNRQVGELNICRHVGMFVSRSPDHRHWMPATADGGPSFSALKQHGSRRRRVARPQSTGRLEGRSIPRQR
jgi:AraC family transcriptional regulator